MPSLPTMTTLNYSTITVLLLFLVNPTSTMQAETRKHVMSALFRLNLALNAFLQNPRKHFFWLSIYDGTNLNQMYRQGKGSYKPKIGHHVINIGAAHIPALTKFVWTNFSRHQRLQRGQVGGLCL